MSKPNKKFFPNDDPYFAWQIGYSNNNKKKSNKPSIYDNIQLEPSSSKKKFLSQSVRQDFDFEDIYDTNDYNKVKTKAKDKEKDDYLNMSKKNTNNDKYNIYDNKSDNSNTNDITPINRDLNSIITSTVGLSNLGNTCFMNTCLQNLIHSEDFIKRLLTKKSMISRSTPISYYFYNLCKELSISTRAVAPVKLKEKFGQKHHLFAGYGQNDTQEFCRILLEDMNNELNDVKKKKPYVELKTSGKSKIQCDREFDENFRGRENSIVMDSFYGQIINIFTCKCGFKDYSFQKVLDLPLLLQTNNAISINDLLEDYFEEEEIKFETKCEKCGKKRVHKKEVKFSQPPNILILSLQRINNRTKRKNSCCVSFPEILDIQNYIDTECGHGNESQYVLYGIGNHSGTINFGHYFAYIKLNDKYWYEFNDSSVSKISKGINTKSTYAYTLFYKKRK